MQTDIMLIDKPKGITSFDVIRRLRKKTGIKKMGHAGTLDPLASGLMIIGVEKGTKKLNDYLKLDKVYEAEVLLGIRTATGDMEGEIVEEREISNEERGQIENNLQNILNGLVGEIELPVSIYSAIKKDGVELYKRARRGEEVEAPIRKMRIYWI